MSDDPCKLRPGLALDAVTAHRLAKSEKQRNVVWPTNRTVEEKHQWNQEDAEKALAVTGPKKTA